MWSKLADFLAKIYWQTFLQPNVPQDVLQFWRISQFLSKVLVHLYGSPSLAMFSDIQIPMHTLVQHELCMEFD